MLHDHETWAPLQNDWKVEIEEPISQAQNPAQFQQNGNFSTYKNHLLRISKGFGIRDGSVVT